MKINTRVFCEARRHWKCQYFACFKCEIYAGDNPCLSGAPVLIPTLCQVVHSFFISFLTSLSFSFSSSHKEMSQHELAPLNQALVGEERMQASHLQLVVKELKNLLIYKEIARYIAFWCDVYIAYYNHGLGLKSTKARSSKLDFDSDDSGTSRSSDFEQLFGWVWNSYPSIAKCCSLPWNLVKCLANHVAIGEGLCELAQIVLGIHSDDRILAHAVKNHGENVVMQMLQIPELKEMEIRPEEFSNCISLIMSSTEYRAYTINLRGEEALVLINMINHFLESCPPNEQNFPRCIRTLKRMCISNNVLPTALVLTDGLSTNKSVPDNCGGLADVYQGLYQGRLVALKSLRVYGNSDLQSLREAFRKEVIIWSHLRHPNIVPFVGVVDEESYERFPLCMVSHWMEHGTLLEYIRNFPSANRLDLLVEIASGLEYLHKYMIHGDLKGSNILIDGQKRARISDFGLAIVTHDTRSKAALNASTTNAGAGSARWLAPELANPDLSSTLKPTRKTDVYSFSMVMVEVFTGAVPFHRQPDIRVIMAVLEGIRPIRPPNGHLVGLSDSVWSLMEHCWHRNPDQRPSMSHVLPKLVKSRDEFTPLTQSCPVATPDTSVDLDPEVVEEVHNTSENQGLSVVIEDNFDSEMEGLGTTMDENVLEKSIAPHVSNEDSTGSEAPLVQSPVMEAKELDVDPLDMKPPEERYASNRESTLSTLVQDISFVSVDSGECHRTVKLEEMKLVNKSSRHMLPLIEPDDPSTTDSVIHTSSWAQDSRALKLRLLATKLRMFFLDEKHYLQEILQKREVQDRPSIDLRGSPPESGDPALHVFVDYSNILIGFQSHLSQQMSTLSSMDHSSQLRLSYEALSLILERGRPISERTVTATSLLSDSMNSARKLGYDVKIHTPTPEQDLSTLIYSTRGRRPGNSRQPSRVSSSTTSSYGSGDSVIHTPSTSTSSSFIHTPPSYREHGGAEQLKLKLFQTIIGSTDPAPPGSTIILATGDGNVGKYNENIFVGCVRTALRRGWKVELYAWEYGLGKVWKREFAGFENFKPIYLENYLADLLEPD